MSDPVTNVQIEDVLSSIRKLVSEEIRSQTRDAAASAVSGEGGDAPAKPEASGGGRLILTPAQRVDAVDGDEAGFVHADEADHEDGEADLLNLMERVRAAGEQVARKEPKPLKGIKTLRPEAPQDQAEQATPEMAIESALAALVNGGGSDEQVDEPATDEAQDAEPEAETTMEETAFEDAEPEAEDDIDFSGGVDFGDDLGAAEDAEDADDIDQPGGEDTLARSDADLDDTIVPTFLRHRASDTLHQRVADVESVMRDQGGDFEPEADEDTDAAPGPQPSALPWMDDEDDVETASADDAPEAETSEPEVQDARAHLRVATSATDDQADAPVTPDVADIAQAFADAQAAEDWEDAEYADDLVAADDQEALIAEDTTVIDEEMLRDMVAEIVRQELQGALGERITRNVRKLVRREIHRALSAQNID